MPPQIPVRIAKIDGELRFATANGLRRHLSPDIYPDSTWRPKNSADSGGRTALVKPAIPFCRELVRTRFVTLTAIPATGYRIGDV